MEPTGEPLILESEEDTGEDASSTEAPLPGVPKRKPGKRIAAPTQQQMALPRKSTDYEIQERRTKVQRLRLRGLSAGSIAKLLGITPITVKRDLEAIQRVNVAQIDEFQQNQFVGESLVVFNEIMERGWSEYSSVPEGHPMRIKSLDLIRTTQNDKLRVLQETGMVRREPAILEHRLSFDLPWDEEVKHAVAEALLHRRLVPQLPEPTPDYLHEPGRNQPPIEVEPITSPSPSDEGEHED